MMSPEDIETKLYELVSITQDMLLAMELGQRSATAELVERLKTILDSLKDSNCHISIFRQKQIVRSDGTRAKLEHELVDYCFIDDNSPESCYFCEISATIVIDGRYGHPIPSKGDVRVRMVRAPEDGGDDEDTNDRPPQSQSSPSKNQDIQETDKDFNILLKKMGFDPESIE